MVDSKDMRYILNWARIHSSLPSHPGEQKHVSHSNNSNGLNVAFMRFHLPGFRVIFARQHLRLSKTHNQQVNLNRLREYCLGMRSKKIYQSRTISVFFLLVRGNFSMFNVWWIAVQCARRCRAKEKRRKLTRNCTPRKWGKGEGWVGIFRWWGAYGTLAYNLTLFYFASNCSFSS